MDTVVGVFAKVPEPGRVKTRLGRKVGMLEAAKFYAGSLAWIVLRLSESQYPFRLFFSPESKRDRLLEWYPPLNDYPCLAQKGDDLGERMFNALRLMNRDHDGDLLLLGTDSPDLPLKYLRLARNRLDQHDVVIGPANDGGYYLIGMSEPHKQLFVDLEWSHPGVLEQTLSRASDQDLSVELLPEWRDYDRLEDLLALVSD